MNERQIIEKLTDQGKKVADLATEIAAEFGVQKTSADNMLRQLIAGQRWYPVYAGWLKENYDIIVEKPDWLRNVRERRMAMAA